MHPGTYDMTLDEYLDDFGTTADLPPELRRVAESNPKAGEHLVLRVTVSFVRRVTRAPGSVL